MSDEEEWYEDDRELSYEPFKYTYKFEDDTTLVVVLEEDEEELIKLTIDNKKPICCAFSAKQHGPLIATGFADGSVFVAGDLKRMYEESTFLGGHVASVLAVAFHPTEPKFASVSLDGKFIVHECRGIRKWTQTQVIASRIGLTAVSWHNDDLVVGTADGYTVLWRFNNSQWTKISQVKMHNGYVRFIVDLPDGQAASGGDDLNIVFMTIRDDQLGETERVDDFQTRFEGMKWDPEKQILKLKCEGDINFCWSLKDHKWTTT